MNGARAARRSLAGGLRPVTVYPQPARLHTKTPLPEDACPTEGFPNPDIVLLKWTLQAHCRRIGSEANGPRDSWRAWRPASSPESSARLGWWWKAHAPDATRGARSILFPPRSWDMPGIRFPSDCRRSRDSRCTWWSPVFTV